jgi:type II pantothenate kinase
MGGKNRYNTGKLSFLRRSPVPLHAAIDFGLTNIDAVLRDPDGKIQTLLLTSNYQPVTAQLEAVLGLFGHPLADFEWIAVTGGQFRQLPPTFGGVRLLPVNEVPAIGRGGLYLAGLDGQGKKAKKNGGVLVVSAGSGTAMVAARGCQTHHVTGSAVGGGTLQGLGRLLLGTADARAIDRLAQQGNANAADLTLAEAIGSTVGHLPADANAVNFGRLARQPTDLSPEDLAAAIVRLVGQVIAVIAINAARAEKLASIVVVGHLADLPSFCQVLHTTTGYYQASITVPSQPGFGTVIGALLCAEN